MSDFASFFFIYKANYLLLGAIFKRQLLENKTKSDIYLLEKKCFFDQPLSSPD